MNFRLVLRVVGRVMTMVAATMLLPALVAALYGESATPFLLSAAVLLAVGLLLARIPSEKHFYTREGFFAVGLIWLLIGAAGALPFWLSGEFPTLADCLFESFSGFTTTGATIFTDIEAHSRGVLFWRSFSHFLGGMGVLVLATAVLPTLGIRSQYLTQAETPGPVASKLVPKQSQTSKILYTIYCVLMLAEVACLRLAGMPLYDAVIHSLSTAGTGGFSCRNASIGAYGSPLIEMIVAVFILLFSVNFAVHFMLLRGRFRDAWKSDELRFFLEIVAVSTLLITFSLRFTYNGVWECLRYAFFQVCSIISTTGFCTDDFTFWPQFPQTILICLMFIGACAGSTGGGIKCSRVLLGCRAIRREIHRIIHPRAVEVVRLDGKVVEEDTLHSVTVFLACYMLFTGAATLLISLDNFSFTVSFTAAITCVSNAGPGLEMVGPAGNFSAFSALSKLTMSFLMVVGRLEIFPILMLFSRGAWKRT